MAAYAGLRWVGVELERRFVELAKWNFELHTGHWRILGLPFPVIIEGDSRRFDELVGQACGIVSSPPFLGAHQGVACSGEESGGIESQRARGEGARAGRVAQQYGTSPGQIGSLPAGDLAAVVSSPPYSDIAAGQGGLNTKPAKKAGQQTGRTVSLPSQNADQRYGDSPGQIGKLKGGELQAVVSSPPYNKPFSQDHPGTRGGGRANGTAPSSVPGAFVTYGQSEGQIEGVKPETYWQAVRDVYAACWRAIKPRGVMVLVLKDYVKNKQRVPLADDTVTLCESLGFKLIERIQAMLVSETRHPDLFNGVDVKTKSRKSFFRRLAESKGSPAIDHEDVLIFRRP